MFTRLAQQIISIVYFLCFSLLATTSVAQSSTTKIDYSQKSNFIHPDTLKGDEKAIFWHFVDLSSRELKEITPSQLKSTFAKLGIVPEERQRFIAAYSFFASTYEGHKESCENWEQFRYLKPD